MIRLTVRSLGVAILAMALAALAVDGARSVAASAVSVNAIGPTWFALSPQTFARFQEFVQVEVGASVGGWVWDPLATWFLGLPASAVLAAAGLLLVLLGAVRRRRVYAG